MSKKQSSFNTRDLKASTPKAKHNLSYRNVMSASFGALLPFMVQEVVAGSSVKIGLEHQTRAQSMPRPSFSRLREHFDYFFVPFSQLYRAYDNFRTQQSNYNSTLFQNDYSDVPPLLPYFKLSDQLVNPAVRGTTDTDAAGMPLVYGTIRLLDLLGYGVNAELFNAYSQAPQSYQLMLNPFRLCAYQKIYFDYYRNDKYEANSSEFYNLDDIPAPGSGLGLVRLQQLTRLNYRWRKKDYYTQVTPDVLPTNQQFNRRGFTSTVQMEVTAGNQYMSQLSSPLQTGTYNNTVFNSLQHTTNPVNDPNNQTTPLASSDGSTSRFTNAVSGTSTYANQSVINHKWASAIDKLYRRMYAANSDFSSQMLAIFGVAPVEGRHGRVSHIGGYSQILGISDVDNNTQADPAQSSMLGNSADPVFGKINQYGDTDSFTYRVKEDGIIMGIYSTSMESDYSSARVDRHNLKLRTYDYFIPEFANMGKQALFSVEYQNYYYDSNGDIQNMPLGVIGFIPRYDEYRSHVDECHGSFAFGSNEAYVAPMNSDLTDGHLYMNIVNLIYKPSQVDRIFAVNANGEEKNDQFMLNLYNKIKVISPVPLRVEV